MIKKQTVFEAAASNLAGKRLTLSPGGETKLTRLDAGERIDPDKRPMKALLAGWVFAMIGTLEGFRKAPMMDRHCQRFELWVKGNGDLVVRYFRMMDCNGRRRLVDFESVPLGSLLEVIKDESLCRQLGVSLERLKDLKANNQIDSIKKQIKGPGVEITFAAFKDLYGEKG